MSSVDSKLYQYAVSTAKEAVALDNQGKFRQAINKYNRAAEILLQFVKYNKKSSNENVVPEKHRRVS